MGNKYAKLFEYFRQCPELENLWSIAATEERDIRVILPQGTSPTAQYDEKIDNLGGYACDIIPYPSVYEDFQINCYEWYDSGDGSDPIQNINVLTFEEVTKICDWIKEQNDNENFPKIGEKIVSISCEPFTPQLRYVSPEENTVGYFITVRIRYVNRMVQRKSVYYECED